VVTLPPPTANTEKAKSPVQLALEQADNSEENLLRGGSSQSKSFKILEQELHAEGDNSNGINASSNGTSEMFCY